MRADLIRADPPNPRHPRSIPTGLLVRVC